MANTKVTKAVLADDAVGLAQLDITNDPSDGQALTAVAVANGYNLTWANNTVAGITSSADATAITIDSNENVLIGVTSLNRLGSGSSAISFSVGNTGTGATDSAEAYLYNAATASGRVVGAVCFGTSGASASEKRSALISSKLSATSSTNVSGELNFYTTNAGSIDERMTITAAGRTGLHTTNPDAELHIEPVSSNSSIVLSNDGRTQYYRIQNNESADALTFNLSDTNEIFRISDAGIHIGGTADANALDDYEEGTWTPTLAGYSFGNISATYTSQSGTYRKFGNLVYITVGIAISAISSQPSGTDYPVVNGMPFAQTGSSYVDNGNVTRNSALRSSPVITKAMGGGSSIFLGVDQSTAFPPWANSQPFATGELSFTMWYYTS